MSTPERLPRIPEQDDDSSTQKEANLSTATRPRTRSRTKRFEIGFFVRKVVNGWVVFYKQFPPAHRAQVFAQVRGATPREGGASEQGQPVMKAMSHSAPGDFTAGGGGGVTTYSGTGAGTGDTGPVGSSRVDAGVYAAVVTETTTSEDATDE